MTTTALDRWTARQHNRPQILAPTMDLRRGQIVHYRRLVGPTFMPDWTETAKIIGKPHSVSPTSGFWWPVRFADGGELCIHEESLRQQKEENAA